MEQNKVKRDAGLDLLKTVAIICVCYCHYGCMYVDSTDMTIKGIIKILIRLFNCTAVPIFFMTNGALTLHKEYSVERCLQKAAEILKKLMLYIPITVLGYNFIKNGEFLDFKTFLNRCWNWQGNGVQHLWFLFSLMCIYLLYPFICYVLKQQKKVKIIYGGLLFIFTFGNSAINLMNNIYHYFKYGGGEYFFDTNFFNGPNFFYGWYSWVLVYFIAGDILWKHILNKKFIKRQTTVVLLILGVISAIFYVWACRIMAIYMSDTYFMLYFWGYNQIFMLIIAVLIFCTVLQYIKISNTLQRILEITGDSTLGILFFHRFIGEIVKKIFANYNIDINTAGIMYGIISTGIVFCVSLCLTVLIKRWKIVRKFF